MANSIAFGLRFSYDLNVLLTPNPVKRLTSV